MRERGAALSLIAAGLALTAANSADPAPQAPDGPGELRSLELQVSRISVRPQPVLQVVIDGLQGDVRPGLHLSQLHASLTYELDRLEISSLRFGVFGGSAEQTGEIRFDEGRRFELTSQFRDLDVGTFAGGFPEGKAPRLAGEARLQGPLPGAPDWQQNIEGDGSIDLRGGVLPDRGLLRALAAAILGRVPGMGKVSESPGGSQVLESVTATVEVHEGRLHTDDLLLVTSAYRAKWVGSMGLDLSLAFDGQVTLTDSGLQHTLSLAGLGLGQGFGAIASVPSIPVRVGGTLQKPSFRPEVRGLPLAAWKLVPGTVGLATDAVGRGAGLLEGAGGLLGERAKQAVDAVRPHEEAP